MNFAPLHHNKTIYHYNVKTAPLEAKAIVHLAKGLQYPYERNSINSIKLLKFMTEFLMLLVLLNVKG